MKQLAGSQGRLLMKPNPEKEAEFRRLLEEAKKQLAFRAAEEVRKNPAFYGRIGIELTFQGGRITLVEPIIKETIVPT